jgi:hypothetical protein
VETHRDGAAGRESKVTCVVIVMMAMALWIEWFFFFCCLSNSTAPYRHSHKHSLPAAEQHHACEVTSTSDEHPSCYFSLLSAAVLFSSFWRLLGLVFCAMLFSSLTTFAHVCLRYPNGRTKVPRLLYSTLFYIYTFLISEQRTHARRHAQAHIACTNTDPHKNAPALTFFFCAA